MTGANTPLQTIVRPRLAARPLRDRRPRRLHLLGGDPARAGAHGMCGLGAAESVLRRL